MGFATFFVSNSPLGRGDRVELAAVCADVLQRGNTGFDFAMWQTALNACTFEEADEILLTNSSIIGPLGSLENLWAKPELQECDFWGLTDNSDITPHIQSYFMVFRRRAVAAACFGDFWQSVLPYQDKMQIIRSYEVGLTVWLQQHGFTWRAAFPQAQVLAQCRVPRGIRARFRARFSGAKPRGPNTTLSMPRELLDAGMPFLKAALIAPDNGYLDCADALSLLAEKQLPAEALDDLRRATDSGRRTKPV
jgi:hypothetical protein